MKTRHSMYEIRNVLQGEISGAINETSLSLEIEIPEVNVEGETYLVKGTFKVIPFFSLTLKRKGKFEAKLDEDLKIISLKITEGVQ